MNTVEGKVSISESDLNEVFPRNPLRQVAFEVRFPRSLRVARDLCQVQEEFQLEYPILGLDELQGSIDLSSPSPVTVHVFRSHDGTRSLKVGADRLALVYTTYTKFESFSQEANRIIDRFCEMFPIKSFSRVGLRYVNNIGIPIEGRNFLATRYVRPYVDLKQLEGQRINKYSLELTTEKEGAFVTSRTAILVQQEKGIYVLDLDAFTHDELKPSSLPDISERLHYHIQVEFLSHITDAYKEYMRRSE